MKQKYPFTYKQAIKCIIYFIVFTIMLIGARAASNLNRVYYQFFGYIFIIVIFLYKYLFFKKKIKVMKYMSINAIRCMKMFEYLIACLTGIVFIGIIIIVKNRAMWNEYLLMWQFGLLLTFYAIAIFYPFIVVFGENSYISGSFEMCYDEIEKIVDIKTYEILGTEIKKCEIVTKTGKKCMEKFMVDEYNVLCSFCITTENTN